MAIRGGKVKSIKKLKSSLKRGANQSFLKRIPKEGLTVRFMTEPDEWIEYYEYYDVDVKHYVPEVEGVVPNIEEGKKSSKRYLACVVDVMENKVEPLVLPKQVASAMLKKYDKYSTILDRDYEITREGDGLDTEYDVTPEPASKMNMSRFTVIDLYAALESQVPGGAIDDEDEDDEDEDDEPAPRRSKGRTPGKKSRRDEPEDDEDFDDDEDEDDEPVRRKPAKSVSKTPTKKKPVKKKPVKR